MQLRRLVNVVLGLTLAGILFTVALDWDHLWVWILQVPDPVNFSETQGRPFHTVGWFLLQSIAVAFVFGLLEPRIMDRSELE